MTLRYDEIGEIVRLIDNSSCDELVVETPELRLVVRRRGAAAGPAPAASVSVPARPMSGNSAGGNGAPAAAPAAAAQASAPGEAPAGIEVRAPMVGTFYRSPKPDAPPFVEKGSRVEKGAPLCLIEVMKLFSTITAETAGRVVHVGAENGELVEFGRVLFVIEPDAGR
jgi:acetyl-CoA carboxylase biotin carboxyl carrier protein